MSPQMSAPTVTAVPDRATEPASAGRPSSATNYRSLLTLRFSRHGKEPGGHACRCGLPWPCEEERHIALLLEMDVGDDVGAGPPPPGRDDATLTWPRPRQLTGPTAPNGPVSAVRRTGGVTKPAAAGPATIANTLR